MISVKELRIGDIVRDGNGKTWRVGCVTDLDGGKPSVILERPWYDGTVKWYTDESDVMPVSINGDLLDMAGFKGDEGRGVYRGYGISIKVFGDEYYFGLRDMTDGVGDLVQVRHLHQLQNALMDLHGRDMTNIERLYDYTGE